MSPMTERVVNCLRIERLLNKNQVTVLNGLKYFLIANESYFKIKIQLIFGYEIKKTLYLFFQLSPKTYVIYVVKVYVYVILLYHRI